MNEVAAINNTANTVNALFIIVKFWFRKRICKQCAKNVMCLKPNLYAGIEMGLNEKQKLIQMKIG